MKCLFPDWPAPSNVHAISTTKEGGVSLPPYTGLNLGNHVGDNPAAVAENRRLLVSHLELTHSPVWLDQVHGTRVITLPLLDDSLPVQADAAFTSTAEQVCAVMTADCLPVLFCDVNGKHVAAAHAGWRGLLHGMLDNTLALFPSPHDVMVWLGPAIGAQQFEVGDEVRSAFIEKDPSTVHAFSTYGAKWLADIYFLARLRLLALGVNSIYGGQHCTVTETNRFYSYRREQTTGRQASLIWLSTTSST